MAKATVIVDGNTFGMPDEVWQGLPEEVKVTMRKQAAKITLAVAENDRLKQAVIDAETARKAGITPRVSERGALSLYGLGKFPVTLYLEQWRKIFSVIKDGTLDRFVETHKSEFAVETADERRARNQATYAARNASSKPATETAPIMLNGAAARSHSRNGPVTIVTPA